MTPSLGPAQSEPIRLRGPAAPHQARDAGLVDGRAAPVSRVLSLTTNSTRSGCCWPPAGCDEAKLSASVGRTWICAKVDCRSASHSPRAAASCRSRRQRPRSRGALSLDPATVAVLRTHRAQQGEEQLAAGVSAARAGSYSPAPTVRRRDPTASAGDSLSSAATLVCRSSGSTICGTPTPRSPYPQAAHPKVVAERLGHSTIAITLDTYSHVLPSLEEETANRLAQLILGPATAG